MNFSRHVNYYLKSVAISAGVAVAASLMALVALAFMITGFFVFMHHFVGEAAAAAITAGMLLLLAVAMMLAGRIIIKRMKRRKPSLAAEFGGAIGMATRIVGMVVRNDPKKAMIISLVAGALAEYIASDRRR